MIGKRLILLIIIFSCLLYLNACIDKNIEDVSIIDEKFNEECAISLINKWHSSLYDSDKYYLLTELLNACIQDSKIKDILKELELKEKLDQKELDKISNWTENNITHTQILDVFKDKPGKDPWGQTKETPTYKKLLPSEMEAMKIFSGKYTGKCTSITNFIYALLKNEGMNSENCVILRTKGHTLALLSLNNRNYCINNNRIYELNDRELIEISNYTYYGFYNDKHSYKGKLNLDDSVFCSEYSLFESLIRFNDIKEEDIYNKSSDNRYLKYALQELTVNHPELYIEASIKGPLVNELAKEIKNEKDIIEWITNNINNGSIFTNDYSIQTADQTITFNKGTAKDKGLLMSSLLRINNQSCELLITKNDAYIKKEGRIYSMNSLSIVKDINDEVIYYLVV